MNNFVLVLGRGHTHNEFLSWIINNSLSVQKNEIEDFYVPYPGPLGTFMRHNDDAFLLLDHPEFTEIYNNKYRMALFENVSKYTREQFVGLLDSYNEYKIGSNSSICIYLNCTNAVEVSKWASEFGIPCISADPNIKFSKIRSHYIQMEFSPGAAQDIDYNTLSMTDKEIANFLIMLDNNQKMEHQQIIDKNSSLIKVDINKLFNLDIDYMESIFDQINLQVPDWTLLNKRIVQFAYINDPQNEKIKIFNTMSFKDIGLLS